MQSQWEGIYSKLKKVFYAVNILTVHISVTTMYAYTIGYGMHYLQFIIKVNLSPGGDWTGNRQINRPLYPH